ncbi:MAG: hypothetical protein GY827_03465, partial [Cytophagales bacterium]|nr:hypothetical protein [Cytophagales bacterium]
KLDYTIYANPALIAFNNLNSICSYTSDTLAVVRTNTKSTFDWYINDIKTHTDKDSITYLFADTAVTFKVIETNEFGCTTDNAKKVTIKGQPGSFTAKAVDPLLCSADSALFVIDPISPTSTYSWTFGGNVTGVTNYTPAGDSVYIKFKTTSDNDTDNGFVTVLQTDTASGCTTLDGEAEKFNFTITTTPLTVDSISFDGNFLCDTEGDIFTAYGGKPQYDFLWSTDFTTITELINAADKGNTVNAKFTLTDSTQNSESNIKVAQNNGGCIGDSVKLDYTIYANPALIAFNNLNSICSYTSDTLAVVRTNTKSTFDWYINDIKTHTDKDSITYLFADTTVTFKVIETNEFGCTTDNAKKVTVKGRPDSFDAKAVDPLLCSADSALFVIDPISPNSTYSWTFGGNVTGVTNYTTAGDSVYIKFKTTSDNDTDNGFVTVSQTDLTTGCTTLPDSVKTFDFTITTTPLTVDSINFAGNFLCDTEGDIFTAYGGKPQYDFLWSTDSTTITTLVNAADKGNTVNAKFTLTDSTQNSESNIKVAQNNGGCIGDSVKLDYTIYANPALAKFSDDGEVCAFTKDTMSVIVTNPKSTFSWFLNNVNVSNDTTFTYDFKNDSLTFKVIETNEFGCTTQQDRTIKVKSQPNNFSVVAGNPLLCSADSALFVINPINSNATYTWSFGGNVTSINEYTASADSVYVKFNSSTNDTENGSLTVLQTDLTTGCTTLADSAETLDFTITTTPDILDSITFAGSKYICDGSTIEFTAHGGKSQYDYLWGTDFLATTTLLDADNKANIVNASFNLNNTLDTLTNMKVAQNNGGCIGDSLKVDFIINRKPKNADIEGSEDVCIQTSSFVKIKKSEPENTLEWKLNGFTITGFTGDSLSLFFTSEPRIEILETNEFGCTKIHVRQFHLLEQPDGFDIIGSKSLLCSSDTAVMYQIDPKDVDSSSTYTWDASKSNVINTLTTDGNNADSVFVTFNDPIVRFAEAKLVVSETNKYGCTTISDSVAVKIDTVFQTPKKISGITPPDILCDTQGGEFYAKDGNSSYEFIWSTKTETTTTITNKDEKVNPAKVQFNLNNTTDTLANIFVYQNNNGCIGDLDSLEFFIHTNPKDAMITGVDSVCSFTKNQLIAVKPHEKTVFDWTTNGFEEKGKDTISYQFADTAVTFTITQTNQ